MMSKGPEVEMWMEMDPNFLDFNLRVIKFYQIGTKFDGSSTFIP